MKSGSDLSALKLWPGQGFTVTAKKGFHHLYELSGHLAPSDSDLIRLGLSPGHWSFLKLSRVITMRRWC